MASKFGSNEVIETAPKIYKLNFPLYVYLKKHDLKEKIFLVHSEKNLCTHAFKFQSRSQSEGISIVLLQSKEPCKNGIINIGFASQFKLLRSMVIS